MWKKYWPLLAILLLAAALRLYRLDTFPSGLYWEEVALGYDAYSILRTGKDYHGNPWPLVAFPSFGDYKPSGYFYLTVPFVGFFGLNEWGVRLPSAAAGIMCVLMVYLIAHELTNNKRLGLLTAFILAVMPWHIQFSRAAFEANVATTWMCVGVWLLLKSRQNNKWLLVSTLPMALSLYTYHSARITVPLLAVAAILIYWKHYALRYLIASFALALLLVFPILIALNTPVVTQRFAETSYFAHTQVVENSNLWRAEDRNTWLSRFTHHRYWYWGKEILSSVLTHLNPLFLFLVGDTNPRHQTGYFGLLFWWMIIPLLAGVKKIIADKSRRGGILLIAWFLAAGLAPALTNLAPHTLRFLLAAPLFAILMGYGMENVVRGMNSFKQRSFWLLISILVIGFTQVAYAYDYLVRYQNKESHEWQYAYKEAVELIQSRGAADTQVYLTPTYGRPSMYVLFYLEYPPELVQTIQPSTQTSHMELLAFDKFQFTDPDMVTDGLVISEKPYHRGTLIKQISFLDESVAFYVYEI